MKKRATKKDQGKTAVLTDNSWLMAISSDNDPLLSGKRVTLLFGPFKQRLVGGDVRGKPMYKTIDFFLVVYRTKVYRAFNQFKDFK